MLATRSGTGVLEVQLASEEDTARLGRAIAEVVSPGTVIGLTGPLGAGKTRLTRAIAEALGVDPSAISSPTFVLIQEYEGRLPVYHFDTYRLPTPEAFEELGSAEYWRDGVSLVEWADRVESLLPDDRWRIAIEPADAGPSGRRARIAAPPMQPELADALLARLTLPATDPDSSSASAELTT
ncbi:MAG: tRNA (adenosine(37)-N6)-threonylcarbamoyltransferase complex ATPase subunit type 1 TsaE [Isosphaeraceae bacterium]